MPMVPPVGRLRPIAQLRIAEICRIDRSRRRAARRDPSPARMPGAAPVREPAAHASRQEATRPTLRVAGPRACGPRRPRAAEGDVTKVQKDTGPAPVAAGPRPKISRWVLPTRLGRDQGPKPGPGLRVARRDYSAAGRRYPQGSRATPWTLVTGSWTLVTAGRPTESSESTP